MENKENTSKKIILSVVAIAVLLIMVTFTSFAFFNYYRTGAKNNSIVTGRIKLEFITDDTNNINLTNQFPISDVEAIARTSADTEIVETQFKVTGYAGGSVSLEYSLSALAGDAVTGRKRMPDNHIKLYLQETHDAGTVTIANGFGTADATTKTYGAKASAGRGSTDTSSNGVIKLAEGSVGTTDTTHTYTLRMWISGDVTISDTDTTKDYCASTTQCSGDRNIFSTMYYSLKLRVENLPMD